MTTLSNKVQKRMAGVKTGSLSRSTIEREIHGLTSKLTTACQMYLESVRKSMPSVAHAKLAKKINKCIDGVAALSREAKEAIRQAKIEAANEK